MRWPTHPPTRPPVSPILLNSTHHPHLTHPSYPTSPPSTLQRPCPDGKCIHPFYIRREESDPKVAYQMMEEPLLDGLNKVPGMEYILDAGANVGIGASIFATMWVFSPIPFYYSHHTHRPHGFYCCDNESDGNFSSVFPSVFN